jgi:hypothetical protein
MLFIRPEVVQMIAHDGRVGDAVVGVQDLERIVEESVVLGVGAQRLQRRGVPGRHPLQRPLTLHFLQPHERIIRSRRLLSGSRASGTEDGGGGERGHRQGR